MVFSVMRELDTRIVGNVNSGANSWMFGYQLDRYMEK